MTELPLNKQFALQKILNDIDTLNESDAKDIAKKFAQLYYHSQQTWINLSGWQVK
jgi:hypothetical protein